MNFVRLPPEILHCIFAECLPLDQTILITVNERKRPSSAMRRIGIYSELPEGSFALFHVPILATLARIWVYANNTFSFTTIETLEQYLYVLSPVIKESFRKIEICACGEVSWGSQFRLTPWMGTRSNWDRWKKTSIIRYKHAPAPHIPNLLLELPGLTQCRLIGIGPNDSAMKQKSKREFIGQRRFWRLNYISLIARIVGIAVDDEIVRDEIEKTRKRKTSSTHARNQAEFVLPTPPGPLVGGRVFCVKFNEERFIPNSVASIPGERGFGTVIVRHGLISQVEALAAGMKEKIEEINIPRDLEAAINWNS